MQPIYTKLNLEQYITKVSEQKSALSKSTVFEPSVIESLLETYDLQIKIATRTFNQLNNIVVNPGPTKMHTLVFGTNPASKTNYFQSFLDKKNVFEVQNILAFNNNCCYLNTQHQVIAINNITKQEQLKQFVLSDYLEIKTIHNLPRRINTLPFIIGCNFPIEKLDNEIKFNCNIVELDKI